MAYATIENILSQVSPKAPPDPSLFPDFDPQDMKAWAYFIYLYIDSAQGQFDELGYSTNLWQPGKRPGILPVYNNSAHALIQTYTGFTFASQEKCNRLRRILDYITYCMTVWRIPPEHITYSTRKLGFKISSYDDYDYCFERAKTATSEAWRRAMYFTARELYPYAFPGERDTSQPNAVASGKSLEEKKTGEEEKAFIIPDIAILFLETNREWHTVFSDVGSGNLEIHGGYRTLYWQTQVGQASQSAHCVGAALDVLPSSEFYNCMGKNISIAYLCWLFHKVAELGECTRSVRLSNNDIVVVTPQTIFEAGNTCHVSYGWLLQTLYPPAIRKDVIPEFLRPYSGDVPRERDEFWAPGNPSPLLDEFDADNMGLDTLTSSAGITARWLAGYISHRILEVAKENKKTGVNEKAFGGVFTPRHVVGLIHQYMRFGK